MIHVFQNWFIDSSDLVSGVCKKPVEWVTPLGLPVLQPYFMKKLIHMPGVNVVQSEQSLHE
jgi:DNA-directed RNA polymerase